MQASGSLAGGERWRVCVKTSEVDGGAEGSLRIRTRDQRVRVLEIMHRCAVLPWDTKTGFPAGVGRVQVAGGSVFAVIGRRRAGRRCTVVVTCRPSSPFPIGPFEAVS